MNQKTIDRIRDNCNEKLKEKYAGCDGHTIDDFMIIIILQEFFKEFLKENKCQ